MSGRYNVIDFGRVQDISLNIAVIISLFQINIKKISGKVFQH